MRDKLVDEIRKIRKEIESENGNDWNKLKNYFNKIQNRHKDKLYRGAPKSLSKRDVA